MISKIHTRDNLTGSLPITSSNDYPNYGTASMISPTYANNIDLESTNKISVVTISKDSRAEIEKVAKELGQHRTYTWGIDGSLINGNAMHVYEIGDLAKEMDIPMDVEKIVGYENQNGEYQIDCSLKNGQFCEIVIDGQPVDMPMDASTFKNVALKALKMTTSANEQCESIGRGYKIFGSTINYDPTTKRADFETLKSRLGEIIQIAYKRQIESNANIDTLDTYLNDFYKDFYDELYK